MKHSFLTCLIGICWTVLLSGQVQQPTELLEQLEQLGDTKERVGILNQLGKHYAPNDYSKALYYLQEARSLAIQLNLPREMADADLFASRVYYYQDDYLIAKKYLDKAREGYQSIMSEEGLGDYYFALGELEMLFGNFVNALDAYQNALEIEMATNDRLGEAIILNCLSGLHRGQGNLDESMKYNRLALKIRYAVQDSAGLATSFTSIASIHELKNELDSARFYYEKGLSIRQEMKDSRRISASLYRMGRIYNAMNQPEKATQYLDQSFTIFQSLEEKTGMILVLLELGKARSQLNEPDQSRLFIEQAHEMALNTGNQNLIKDTYHDISDHYIKNGNFRLGYDFFVRYKQLEDSLHNWRKGKLIEEMEMRFQNQQKDSEIAQLRIVNKIQQKNNIILWLSLISFVAISGFIFYLYRGQVQRSRQNHLLLEKEKIIREKDHQMQEKERISLEQQLESKNRELGAKILSMLRNNEMQEKLVSKLGQLSRFIDSDQKALKELNAIIHELENQSAENLWDEFDKTFRSIHTDFYHKLLKAHPDLSPSEIKIATFLKLNLSTKEIAALTFKSESGIKSMRHRLRKKLNISSESNLVNYLLKL
jgi:tetratricopeptide (TPR) repeat protein